MAPRIQRPVREEPRWLLALASSVVALGLGYAAAARVFNPGAPEPDPTEPAPLLVDAAAQEPAVDATAAAPLPDVQAPARPVVPVRVLSAMLQSCGDGDELNIPGAQCGTVPALENALRERLLRMGTCTAAETAARTPERLLSVGLRVDFARRTVTTLLGRSTSLASPLPYVACARSVVENSDELWTQQPQHPRYLLYFAVRFGPMNTPMPPPIAVARPPAPSASGTPATPIVAANGADAGTPTAPTYPIATLRRPEPGAVVWSRAVVRESPRNGVIVTRLPQNTQVEVLARSGSWWQVRFGAGLLGWVFGEAIGRGEAPAATPPAPKD